MAVYQAWNVVLLWVEMALLGDQLVDVLAVDLLMVGAVGIEAVSDGAKTSSWLLLLLSVVERWAVADPVVVASGLVGWAAAVPVVAANVVVAPVVAAAVVVAPVVAAKSWLGNALRPLGKLANVATHIWHMGQRVVRAHDSYAAI